MAVFVVGALGVAACSSSSNGSPGTSPPSTSTSVATTTATTVASSPTASSAANTAAPNTSTAATTAETVAAAAGYSATITRTSYDVAHIVADDWGSLGFGQGYAFAQDRACTLIDQVIKVRGERSKWFGPGTDDANLNSDFAYRHLGLHEDADTRFGHQPTNVAEMVTGYVAGFDKELDAEGPHGWCAGQPWVQPITTTDLYAYLDDVLIIASSGKLINPIATAQPPAATTTATTTTTPAATATSSADGAAPSFDLRPNAASNGWAIGSALSESGGGMLLANPHFPWEGEERLWESQLTLTDGEMNVYGATLSGIPGVLVGFNDAVAWTHTVSAGYRMTLYSLTLVPGDPTSYKYGDTTMAMTSKDISIDVLQPDGTTAAQSRTMWSSKYGPMLNLPFGWTTDTAYTVRDANINNTDVLAQFLGMDMAKNMDDFIAVHKTANGIPWVNTIATSADGRAWYSDTSATPNLSPAAIATWQANVAGGGLAKAVLDNGAILLDGSDPGNEWVDDPAATRPGILPFSQQPQLERDDYVFNANDSHWLANPTALLTGFSPLTGREAVTQSTRTRENARLLVDPEIRGTDGKFSLTDVQNALFSNRGLHSDLLLDDVVAACDNTPSVMVGDQPYELAPLCDILANWSGRYDVDAKGAPLWREMLTLLGRANRTGAGDLYSVGFDPTDPVGTPNTLAADPNVVLTTLAQAATAMVAAGFATDAALGDMQYDGRAIDERIPLPGGEGVDGTMSVVSCCSGTQTLAPKGDPGTFSKTDAFSDKGYPVTFGDSFIMTLEFTKAGPHAEALLTYGQPDDPTNPDFIDQIKLFANGTFRAVEYTTADIKADPNAKTTTVTGPK